MVVVAEYRAWRFLGHLQASQRAPEGHGCSSIKLGGENDSVNSDRLDTPWTSHQATWRKVMLGRRALLIVSMAGAACLVVGVGGWAGYTSWLALAALGLAFALFRIAPQ